MEFDAPTHHYGGLIFEDGFDGQLRDSNPFVSINLNYLAHEGAIPIRFGTVVVNGERNGTCRPPERKEDNIVGIALRCSTQSNYKPPLCIPILKFGFVWVTPIEGVNRGDPVTTPFNGKEAGSLGSKIIQEERLIVPYAVWETDASRGQRAVVRLNM